MNYVILGAGARGNVYAEIFTELGSELKAVCEKRVDRLQNFGDKYGVSPQMRFLSDKAFFKAGKLAELCVVSTQDADHVGHALAALAAGYDLLLEKPIAVTMKDCRAIYDKADSLNRRVFVCHVLRYSPFFDFIKRELDTGKYGKIATLNLTENVAYWHQAHSYVRGNWRTVKQAAPMIIAKSCHDIDIISWLVNSECKAVSSMGSLGFYKPENAPENSSDRCLTCPAQKTCAYDAEKFYITDRVDKGNTLWPVSVLCEEPTHDNVLKALRCGPYGRCVFKCDNDVVDRQIVNMEFSDGATAHLTMTAFSENSYREIHVHCEKGEIYGNMLDNVLTCNIFGGETKSIDVNSLVNDVGNYSHGGGDYLMIKDIVAAYEGRPTIGLTSIKNSMQSHAIGFAAEESRLKGGKVITPSLSNKQ